MKLSSMMNFVTIDGNDDKIHSTIQYTTTTIKHYNAIRLSKRIEVISTGHLLLCYQLFLFFRQVVSATFCLLQFSAT